MRDFIPFSLPDIGNEEIAEITDTLKSGWITTGPKTKIFEEKFAEAVGAKHALAVNSATAGLHLSLDAIGTKKNDIIITTPYTFTATAEVIRYFNAISIFCDIDPETFNIDPEKLDLICEAICQKGDKVKAIIPVHFSGMACDMKKLKLLSEKYDFTIIEDAAHAFPAEYAQKKIGSISPLSVFSFYATKTMTTGEGGMITTNNESFARQIKKMRLHGINTDVWNRYNSEKTSWYYEVVAPGYKYNLTDIASSMGLCQLKKSERFRERRMMISLAYDQNFKKYEQVMTPPRSKFKDAFHLYPLRIPKKVRDVFIHEMKRENILCSVHFIPLHLHPYWRQQGNYKPEDFPNALASFEREVSIPLYSKLSDNEVERIIKVSKKILEKHL